MTRNPLDPRRTPRTVSVRDRHSATLMAPLDRVGAWLDELMTSLQQRIVDARLRVRRALR